MGHIDTIFATGDDALGNQAEIHLLPLSSIFTIPDPITFRATLIDIPEIAVGTYTVDFKTQRYEKPSGKIETPLEFTFSFRADKYWVIYQALRAWNQYIADNDSGAMAEDVGAITGQSGIRTDVVVKTLDSNGVITYAGWKFQAAWPKTIGPISFDQANGDPLIIQVTMPFLKMIDA